MISSVAAGLTELELFSLTGLASLLAGCTACVILYAVCTAVYNVFLHPLKHIPGPILAGACGIPYGRRMRNGTIVAWVKELHEKYGEAVRLAPNEVSFISGETAWRDIYGFRVGQYKHTGAYLKDRSWFAPPVNGTWSIIAASEADHTRVRRNLSHAFSEKALREQESLIQSYVDLLIHRMSEHAAGGKDIDMMRWYNYTTFDVIADLAFGESLYCLQDSKTHSWVNLVVAAVKAAGITATQNNFLIYRYLDAIRTILAGKNVHKKTRSEFAQKAKAKVTRRLEQLEEEGLEGKADFISHIVRNQEKDAQRLTRQEMDSNAVTFLIAGSETTATTLSGATYLLLRHPKVYAKLVHEIRSRFSSTSQITMQEVNTLEYLIAVFQESLRIYPPVSTGFPRVVPNGGGNISGYYIPGGTSVYVSQHAANHSERNFKDPETFAPERWLGDKKYKDDKKECWNAFSFGPRNCLGKNLALAEMRLILSKVLFTFDLELVDKERDWMGEQKFFVLWEKGPLYVKLKPVQQ